MYIYSLGLLSISTYSSMFLCMLIALRFVYTAFLQQQQPVVIYLSYIFNIEKVYFDLILNIRSTVIICFGIKLIHCTFINL